MNSLHCCHSNPRAGRVAPRQSAWLRRAREVAGFVAPGAALALVPKCPVCIAAYVALGTGVAMSPASAHSLLRALTALCVCTLAFAVIKRMTKLLRPKTRLTFNP